MVDNWGVVFSGEVSLLVLLLVAVVGLLILTVQERRAAARLSVRLDALQAKSGAISNRVDAIDHRETEVALRVSRVAANILLVSEQEKGAEARAASAHDRIDHLEQRVTDVAALNERHGHPVLDQAASEARAAVSEARAIAVSADREARDVREVANDARRKANLLAGQDQAHTHNYVLRSTDYTDGLTRKVYVCADPDCDRRMILSSVGITPDEASALVR